MRDIRDEIERIINEIMKKVEIEPIRVEDKYKNIDDDDFWEYTMDATIVSTPIDEIEKRIKEELGRKTKIESHDSTPEEMIRFSYEYSEDSAYIDDYRIYFTIETEDNRLFLLVMSFIVDISPIYLEYEDKEDENNNVWYIETSTGERIARKAESEIKSNFNWANIAEIDNKDEEEAKCEVYERISQGELN